MLVSKLKRQLCEAFYVFVNPNTSQERTLIVRSWYLSDFIRKQVFLVKRIIERSEQWKNDLLNPFNKHLGSVHNYLKKLTYYHKHFFFLSSQFKMFPTQINGALRRSLLNMKMFCHFSDTPVLQLSYLAFFTSFEHLFNSPLIILWSLVIMFVK